MHIERLYGRPCARLGLRLSCVALLLLTFQAPTLCAQSRPEGTPTEASPGSGTRQTSSIEGTVLDAATGRPIPNLLVRLYGPGQSISPVRTDATGRFRFDQLNEQAFGVTLDRTSGYFAQDLRISLQAGKKVSGVELKAFKAAVISGRVLDARRHPVTGARVIVLGGTTPGGRYPPGIEGSATTNDLGEYRFGGLPPGNYRLMVTRAPLKIYPKPLKTDDDPSLLKPVLADVASYYPSSGSLDTAGFITLALGQVLEGADISIVREETVCIQSRIVGGEAQNGLAVIRVESESFGSAAVARGEIGGTGGFEVCGLPPGNYHLVASLADNKSETRCASESFSIASRGMRLPDMYLRPLVAISGRLSIDAEGEKHAFPGPATIYLLRPYGSSIFGERTFARVDREGSFTIPAVLPDEYWLQVNAPKGFYVKSATMAGTDVLHNRLNAAGGELDVALGQDGATVTVEVVDDNGRPIPFAIAILGRNRLQPAFAPNDLVARPTDQNGRAVFDGIAPGDYRLLAYDDLLDESAPMSAEFFQAHEPAGDAITLGPGQDESVRFKTLHLQRQN
ncbi:MAG TPA: carboxypeptidase regulatory-like domain-containing protein [Bryobacteraceae bacterium]|nr:carboxypeptidase regulatory-like domain-containing protein [Bryobacteraceae bacterium]